MTKEELRAEAGSYRRKDKLLNLPPARSTDPICIHGQRMRRASNSFVYVCEDGCSLSATSHVVSSLPVKPSELL